MWRLRECAHRLIGLHCVGVLAAQLVTAAGYATTRAGIAAFLQMTELAWVYLLDITALHEPTSLCATLGSAIVFLAALAAAGPLDSSPTSPPPVSVMRRQLLK